MAEPIFAEDKDSLQAKLRLTGVPDDSDSEAVFDEAILQVRTTIYQVLGAGRVTEITDEAYNEAATSDAGILRLAAAQVEVFGIKARMLRDAPTFFLNASNTAEEAWNDSGLLREADGDESVISYYEDLFSTGLDSLVSGDTPSSGISMRTFTPENDAQKIIGRSVVNGKGLGGLWSSAT